MRIWENFTAIVLFALAAAATVFGAIGAQALWAEAPGHLNFGLHLAYVGTSISLFVIAATVLWALFFAYFVYVTTRLGEEDDPIEPISEP